jgi:hypothetical protein
MNPGWVVYLLLTVVHAGGGKINEQREVMQNPVNAFKLFATPAAGVAARPSNLRHSATAVATATPAERGSSLNMQEQGEDEPSLIESVATAEGGMAARAAAQVIGDDPAQLNAFCYGLPGSTAPLPDFDPAGFSKGKTKREVYRLREAELLHGRVGMLASLGFLVQENFHPLFNGVGGPAINQIPQLPPALWFGMSLGIGICESLRIQKGWSDPFEDKGNFQQLKEGYYPGDLGFDPLGLKPTDAKGLRDMQNRELNNGRLAMIAAAGFLAQEAATGQTWGPNFCELFPEAPLCPGKDFGR